MLKLQDKKFKKLIAELEKTTPATRKAFFKEGTENYPVGSPNAFLLWWFFYFKDDFITLLADFHYVWIESLLSEKDVFIEGFRGSIKTTIVVAITTYKITNNLIKFAVWKSFESSASVRNTTSIAINLMNDRLEKDYGILFSIKGSKEEMDKKSAGEFDTKNGVKVLANSLGEKLRGANSKKARPDLLILDDIDVDDSVKNPDVIQANYEKITGETFGALNKEGAQIYFLGNTIKSDGIVPRFREEKKNNPYWSVFWQPLYIDGKVVWDFFTESMIEKIRAKETERAFNQNYHLKPIDIYENGLVKEEDLRYYENINLSEFREMYAHADTTHTGKTTSDYFCFAIMGRNIKDNNFYLIDFILEKLDVEKQSRRAIQMYSRYSRWIRNLTYDEKSNQGFGFWIKKLAKDDYNVSIPFKPLKYPNDKVTHFEPHLPHFVANRVYLPKNHKDLVTATNQLLAFPTKGIHDDFVDGISGCLDNFQGLGIYAETDDEDTGSEVGDIYNKSF